MSDLDLFRSLIQEIKFTQPRLYQALGILVERVDVLVEDNKTIKEDIRGEAAIPLSPSDFIYSLKTRTIRFEWGNVVGAIFYELRLGTTWDSASLVARVSNLSVEIDAMLSGVYTFLLKSINAQAEYSEIPSSVIVTVPSIPALTLTANVIDNNVLLDWNEPDHPFEILEYRIYRAGLQIGYVDSSFFLYFEMLGGVYTYGVEAVDLAGNLSPIATLTVTVSQPPDYVLEDSFVSDLVGVYVNVYPMTEQNG